MKVYRGSKGIAPLILNLVDRDSVVGITTRYELDAPGIESWCGARAFAPVQTGLEPTQPPIQWVPGLFPGVKAAGAWS